MDCLTKKLGDKNILTMSSGGTPSRGNLDFYCGDILWLKSGELNDNQNINYSEEKITDEAVKKSSAKIFPIKTVLFAMYGATAGKLGILSAPATTNQAVAGMICNDKVLFYKYLYYFLLTTREEIIKKSWGGAQPNLSQTIIKDFEIPLPPLPEQKLIVKKIEKMFAKIDEAKKLRVEAIKDTESLLPSALHKIFSEGKVKGWEEKELKELCVKTETGDPQKYFNDSFNYIDISSIDRNNKIICPNLIKTVGAPSRARKMVQEGDIVFATTRPYLKNIARVTSELGESIASTGFCVLRSKDTEVLDQNYLFHIVSSDWFVDKVVPLQKGATYPAVSDGDVLSCTIPLPPIAEQKKIVAKLDSLSAKVKQLKALQSSTSTDLDALKKSILHKAFNGEL